jgi:hypothetical protein
MLARIPHPMLKRAITVLLVAPLVFAALVAFAPTAHANGAGHYQTNQGRWHTSIDVSYEVDSGVVTWIVNAKCWVDDYYYPGDLLGMDYYVQCSLFDKPSGGSWNLVDWVSASNTEPYNVFYSPAATARFSTKYSAVNVTWEVDITGGDIFLNLGDCGRNCSTGKYLDNPPNYVIVDATT